MDTIVLKFGGSSLADNEKLQIVANKIIKRYEDNEIVVVVSAQGKTTDNLINQAKELENMVEIKKLGRENSKSLDFIKAKNKELDMLLSTGEQISAAKLAYLLILMGYSSVSLNASQAGIYTNSNYQNAIIQNIDITRIKEELKKGNIVIVTGFQGIDDNNNITTLGRGGSDTTAVALAAELKAKQCYIYSDVDGIYTADPNKITNADKLKSISYDEMYALSSEGAKVLHDRCVGIGERFDVPIITESTFNNKPGTQITHKLESSGIKSIVKKDVSRISVVGYGISSTDEALQKIIQIANKNSLEIFNIDFSGTKISVVFKEFVNDNVLKEIHDALI